MLNWGNTIKVTDVPNKMLPNKKKKRDAAATGSEYLLNAFL